MDPLARRFPACQPSAAQTLLNAVSDWVGLGLRQGPSCPPIPWGGLQIGARDAYRCLGLANGFELRSGAVREGVGNATSHCGGGLSGIVRSD